MGFCSGTDIFDSMAGYIVKNLELPDNEKIGLVMALIEALYAHDWDCETDSRYWNDPIVKAAFKNYPICWDDDESEGE